MNDGNDQGYRRLAGQVLLRAFQDTATEMQGPGHRHSRLTQVRPKHQKSAIAFLYADNPLLILWCTWINISAEQIVAHWEASTVSRSRGM